MGGNKDAVLEIINSLRDVPGGFAGLDNEGFLVGLQIPQKEYNFIDVNAISITHNLNRYPILFILDTQGFRVEAQEKHTSKNEFIIEFGGSSSGKVVYY